MPMLNVNNINMYYEIHGAGKPLVLISGYTANAVVWTTVLDELTKHFQCVIIDNRGAGSTDAPAGPYTVEQMATDAICLIRELKLEKPHVYGNSMGGAIVQTIAHLYGDEIDKAVVGNSSPKFNDQLLFAAKNFLNYYRIKQDPEEQVKLWMPIILSSKFLSDSGKVDLFIEGSLANPRPMSYEGMTAQYAALASFDSRPWLKDIKTKCLVLTGDEDLTCLPKEAEYIQQHIPNSSFYKFTDCSHLPFAEYPVESNKVVIDFFKS